MKTTVFFAAFSIVALSIFVGWSKFTNGFNHNISISVSEDDDTYTFAASYNRADTRKVERYINQSIAPNSLGKSENDYIDATTSLVDKTHFYIRESPGKLKIELNKKENSTASYNRIKTMCDGIKVVMAGK